MPIGQRQDRVPPHSEESERGVLGSVLLQSSLFMFLRSETDLCADSFYIPAHRLIWEAMQALFDAGRPIDPTTLTPEMKSAGTLEKSGGPLFIDGVIEATPTAAHVEHYAAEVSRCYGLRRVIDAARRTEAAAYAPDVDNAKDIAAQGMTALAEVLQVKEPDTAIADEADAALADWDAKVELRKVGGEFKMEGLAIGLKRIDYILDGLQPGLILIGARPSVGKTSLEGQIIASIACRENVPILRITQDSLRRKLTERDICREAKVNLSKLGKGFMGNQDRVRIVEAQGRIKAWKQRIVTNVRKLPDLIATIRADVHRRGTKLVTIDYIQCFVTGDNRVDNDQNGRLENIMMALKSLVFELKVPIVILSQFSRDRESAKMRFGCNWRSQRPVLEDLKGSGALEAAADVTCLMSKVDDMPDEDGFLGNRTVVAFDVAKHKQGAVGVVLLNFNRPMFAFDELSERQQAAVMKMLSDEEDVKVRRKKIESINEPYYQSVGEAVEFADRMQEWKAGQQ